MIATVARQLYGRALMLSQRGQKPTMLRLKCCSSSRGVVQLLSINNVPRPAFICDTAEDLGINEMTEIESSTPETRTHDV